MIEPVVLGDCTLFLGDLTEILPAMKTGNIDMVFTDPPYLKEYLSLYSVIAEQAKRLLMVGGYLFCYGSTEHLPDHLNRINQYLDYYWTVALLHMGGYPRIWNKKLMSGYKPVMVFTNGQPKEKKWMATVANSDMMDKRYHKWGQGIGFPTKVISMLCPKDGIVLDPCLGGGTTAVACVQLGRKFIGIEIDEKYFDIAVKRIKEAQLQMRMEI